MNWVTGLSVLAAMSTVMGGWTALSALGTHTRVSYLMALSAGLLLGVAFFAAIPEVARAPHGMAFVAAGFLGLMGLQRLIAQLKAGGKSAAGSVSAAAVLAALVAHSYVEGLAVGVMSSGAQGHGWLSLPALLFHKLPEGFSLAAVMLLAGQSRARALMATALVGATMLAGMVSASLGLHLWPGAGGVLLGLTGGCLLYMGATEILPGVNRKSWVHVWLALLGMVAVHAGTLL